MFLLTASTLTSEMCIRDSDRSNEKLPNIVSSYNSYLIKKGPELELQENKIVNVEIASSKITNIVIHPNAMEKGY